MNHIVLLPPHNDLFFLCLTFDVEKIGGLCQGMKFQKLNLLAIQQLFYLSGKLVKQGCIYRHPLGTVPHKVRFEKLWRLISGYKAG